jgi:hypothetical protein
LKVSSSIVIITIGGNKDGLNFAGRTTFFRIKTLI